VADPCIIEVAVNGTTARAPRTPAAIAADARACIAAGATIVHNHNDAPMWVHDGVHPAGPYLEAWEPLLATGVLFYATQASGGAGIAIETRWAHHVELARAGLPVLGLVDPGSVSLGGDRVYVNTHDDARYALDRCIELGLAASISIFDPSFLRVALALDRPPCIVKLYFGDALLFGLPPTEPSLDAYLAMLDGTGLPWSVAVLGGDVVGCGLAALAVARGGHLRVGLEDYAGDRTPTNAELVEEAAELVTAGGRRVATPAETRALLGAAGARYALPQ
jgi:uncharacterized protein (DUF849 family)